MLLWTKSVVFSTLIFIEIEAVSPRTSVSRHAYVLSTALTQSPINPFFPRQRFLCEFTSRLLQECLGEIFITMLFTCEVMRFPCDNPPPPYRSISAGHICLPQMSRGAMNNLTVHGFPWFFVISNLSGWLLMLDVILPAWNLPGAFRAATCGQSGYHARKLNRAFAARARRWIDNSIYDRGKII